MPVSKYPCSPTQITDREQIKRWYSNDRWAHKAQRQLRLEPLCRMCLAEKKYFAAEVADHVIPHKGDYFLFWYGELQSLCKAHHDGAKKEIEQRGYSTEIGIDGFPLSPLHPFNVASKE